MNANNKNISHRTVDFLEKIIKSTANLSEINKKIKKISGIADYFENEDEIKNFDINFFKFNDRDEKAEYGDFQTNTLLADRVCKLLKSKKVNPTVIFEPTFGKGNFIISALKTFENIKKIYGVEIYKPYIQITKLKILDYFITNSNIPKPEIQLFHTSIFDFDIKKHIKINENNELLILGNPPWVTNTELSSINSKNLPRKVNLKKHKGIDAITGKGNFDIAEYITNSLLQVFSDKIGNFAFLVKNSVIKNIIHQQNINNYKISDIKKYIIDTKKEFNVSVNASLFYCKLKYASDRLCSEFDFYSERKIKTFGWINNKFVSNTETYQKYANFDGICQYEWRQGLKHDLTKVMEIEKINNLYKNKYNEEFELEDDLVYGILKSSDLKGGIINKTRKFTIVTQKKTGQDTSFIQKKYPKTFKYLQSKQNLFNSRKSSIYKGKPIFSIFGIGDYSFKPYKIAISGLYKDLNFTLIEPDENNKPIMLDDTCYFIGFDDKTESEIIFEVLNSKEVKEFLNSLIFNDTKRPITKELLMRIDIIVAMQNKAIQKNDNDNFIRIRKKLKPVTQTKLEFFG